jgi:cytochrome d ubiquinol oxidase subunit II
MAFVSSSASIAALAFLFMTALFPNLIVSSIADDLSLSVYEASSSLATLKNMSLIALLGLPFVFAYTAVIYWTFWGKVQLGEHSY